ncbi:serine hydrolase [Novosphingobium flavum]|uniref:Serine hydrolase n=2 Tax=Novosphingobium flavum TaxID=1778672 RepID=A0A7X1FPH9_9SPHN|nr:serine hydrolase [Novosphingobium flavum]
MPPRHLPLILALAALPALAACSGGGAADKPLSDQAMAAVVADPGIAREPLARAVDELFADSKAGETRGLVVVYAGKVVAQRYGAGFTADTRQIGWSMAKTVTGVLTGLLVADGRLRLDESVPIPAWQRSGDPRGEITLRQLLQMRSGLRHSERAPRRAESDQVRMLFTDGRDDMAAYAEAQPLEAEPGRTWKYSSATSVILADVAARVLAEGADPARRRQVVADYLKARLFAPLGMRSMTAEFDAGGTFIGSSMVWATARDWARFGEFLRSGGAVAGAQILPRGWVEFMTTPAPRNPGYGGQLWLNRPQANGETVLLPGRAPQSLFGMVGHAGQYVLVSPAQKLTVVRLGESREDEVPAVRDHLAAIVGLFPAR